MFAAWGRFVHRHRWPVLVLSVLSLAPSVWQIVRGATFDNNPLPRFTESGRAITLIERELPKKPPSFGLILGSASLRAEDARADGAAARALASLRNDARVARVVTPFDGAGPDPQHVSRDGRRILATVELTSGPSEFAALNLGQGESGAYAELRALVRSDALEVVPVGAMALNHDFTETATRAIARAERVLWPVVPLLLVFVFGSVIAAALIAKDDDMVGKARALYEDLRRRHTVEYDDNGAIGRRYRRQDEIGTPWAFTIDDQTTDDGTVTVRDRDSLAQERLPLEGVRAWLDDALDRDWRSPKPD